MRKPLVVLLAIGMLIAGLIQGCGVLVAGLLGLTPDDPTPAPVTATATLAPQQAPPTATPTSATDRFTVVEVVDGDTIKVQDSQGRELTVRVIGIDTPETKDPRKPVQCYGKKAAETAAVWLQDRQVTLVPDTTQDMLDKYGRTLAYVEVKGGDYGRQMIEYGLAREYTYRHPYTRQAAYRAAEKKARADREGLWGECPTATPTAKPTPTATPSSKPTPRAKPTPKPKPTPSRTRQRATYYANCDAVRAAGADPIYRGQPGYSRRLDRDGDGVGCE